MLELGSAVGWEPPVITTVASIGEGVDDVVEAVTAHRNYLLESGRIAEVRRRRVEIMVKRARLNAVAAQMETDGLDPALIDRVLRRDIDPWAAALGRSIH
jgi:LAO/AO transport system kinase